MLEAGAGSLSKTGYGYVVEVEERKEGAMPYKMNNLPKHAQEIYEETFDSAEESYREESRPPRRVERHRAQLRENRSR